MPFINKKIVITLAGLASIFLAVNINEALSASQQSTPPPQAEIQYPVVSVTQATPVSHQASITAYGEVKSRNQLALTSQVSGQITYLSPTFLTGKAFKKGELLAKIEPIAYEQALATAEANFADARLALAQEELNSEQAAQEWQQSGLANEQASALVLRKPQLASAKAKYMMAKKEVEKAAYDLAQTQLVAPFDALVIERQVNVGTNVQSGTTIAELYDIQLFEIALPLSPQQWQLLQSQQTPMSNTWNVQLNDSVSQQQWPATFDRFEQHIDSQSRQRDFIAVVEQPMSLNAPLFPGTFVNAKITGNTIDKLWKLPASALIDNNTVWQVNDVGLLKQLAINVRFSKNNMVYVQPVNSLETATIVSRPLSSYLVNMKVDAEIEELL